MLVERRRYPRCKHLSVSTYVLVSCFYQSFYFPTNKTMTCTCLKKNSNNTFVMPCSLYTYRKYDIIHNIH